MSIKPNPRLKPSKPYTPSKQKGVVAESHADEKIKQDSRDPVVLQLQRDIFSLKQSIRRLESSIVDLQNKINSPRK